MRSVVLIPHALLLAATIANASKLPCDLRFSFYLWNAENNSRVAEIVNGTSFSVEDWDFNIEANTQCDVIQSMKISLNGPIGSERIESHVPFMAFGDIGGNINGRSWQTGSYEIVAMAYGETSGGGPVLLSYTTQFTVASDLPPPTTPSPVTSAPGSIVTPIPVSPTTQAPVVPRSLAPAVSPTVPITSPSALFNESSAVPMNVSSSNNDTDWNPIAIDADDLLCPCWDETTLNTTLSPVSWTDITPRMNTYQRSSFETSWLGLFYGDSSSSFELVRDETNNLRTCTFGGKLHRLPETAYTICKSELLEGMDTFFFSVLTEKLTTEEADTTCLCYSKQTLGIANFQDNVFSMVTSNYAVQDYREMQVRITATGSIPNRTEPTCQMSNYGGQVVDASRKYEISQPVSNRCHLHHAETFIENAEALF